jgi:hypothetical protein
MKEIEDLYQREKQKLIQKLLDEQIKGNETDNLKKKKRRIRKKIKAE